MPVEWPHILYSIMLLLLVGTAWLRLRGDGGKEMKHALIWLTLLTVLVLGWNVFAR